MKKQPIILKGPITISFHGIKNLQKLPKGIRSEPLVKSRLDRPPTEAAVRQVLKPKNTPAEVSNRHNRLRHILVVEDESDLRLFYVNVLAHLGYRVSAAEDGEAGWRALEAGSAGPGGYDLMITDNKMPKLSGVELIEKVRSARMELPIILASGALPVDTDALRVAAVLPKPFFIGDLLQTVRDILKDE